ncbi:MAG: hypothetical protein KAU44_00570 [Candidatus Marinimicrobia bacterium]|nr:hypothetical protein [Candidatus Neomarinimicrobiota bacterium]
MRIIKTIYFNIPKWIKGIIISLIILPIFTKILNALLSKNQKLDIKIEILIYFFIATIFLSLIGLIFGAINVIKKSNNKILSNYKIENSAFVAAPMKAFYRNNNGSHYGEFRKQVNNIIDIIEKECEIDNIFYAGKHIKSNNEFEASDVSIKKNFEKLIEREYFILILPENNPSGSVLIEAGYALALNKKSIFFFKKGIDPPFMLKDAPNALENVKIYYYENYDELRRIINNNRRNIFDFKSKNNIQDFTDQLTMI